jgi:glycosyltransferase involved in cell wall biosynthesis
LLIKWWSKSNTVVFRKAKRIFTITDGMKQVLKKYAVNSEIEVVPVWTDNTFFKSMDSMDNPFLKKYNLLGKFVVLYSGNIGISGDVDILIDVANEVKNENIIFLIIGEGAKKSIIEERVRNFGINNVIMLPWQPVSELPYSLSSASLAVISLGIKSSKLSIPSKLYNFLSVGAPLLCISSKGSEVESLVSKYKCGRNFEPGEISGIVNFIVEVAENYELHDFMKNNSLKASKDFSSKNVAKFLHFVSSDFN